jgi:hypothetical protein
MKNYTFSFEIQTLLEQFVGAFNDIIVKRYDNTKTVVPSSSAIKVDFVYAPKQRVYDTLSTPAPGGLTVPVVAVNINGISRDAKRVFNKLEGFFIETGDNSDGSLIKKIPQPVPVNIGISMTIVTKLQSDMDQIVSNFVPYCDPYIIISWKIPNPRNPNNPYEIRSEVLWDGNIQLAYPDNLAANQPYRLTATTNFTIKGWLFKKMDDVVKKIYTIDTNFISSDGTTSENDVVSTKTSIIKDFDTVFGVNQGINVTDFSIQTNAQDIKNFKNTYSTVYGLSSNWEFAYDWVEGNSPSIKDAVLYVQSNSGIEINQELATNYVIVNSARFEDSYTTLNTLSSDWEMIYTYVTENSGIEINQQAVATLVNTNSSFWDLAYSNTNLLSAEFASLYSTVYANSSTTWNYQGLDIKALSGEWVGGNEAYTNLLSNSSLYLLSGTNVDLSFLSVSADWNSVYSNVNTNSSNWDSVYTTTISNSAIWSIEDRLTSGSYQVVLSEDGRLNIPGVLTVPSLSSGRILTAYPVDDIQGFYGQSNIPILQNGVGGTIDISNQGVVTISNQGRDYTNGTAIIGGGTRFNISVTPLGWVFNSDGSVTFPDSTTQTTAFTGVTIPPIDRLDNGTVQVVLNEYGSLLLPASGIISNVVSTDEIGFNIAGLFNFSGQTSVDLNAFNVGLGNPTWGPAIQANPTDYEIIFNDGLVATITGATGTATPGARWDLTGVWQANPTGAPVTIRSKNYRPSVLGTDGIRLTTNNKNWTFKNDGSVTFPDSTTQTTAFTGVTIPPSDRLNNGTVQVVLSSDNLLHFPTGIIGDTLQDGGFTVLGNPGSYAELASNDGNVYAWAADTNYGNPVGGGFSIGTDTTTLTGGHVWTFGNDGLLHFPDGSIQPTAFTNNLDLYASLNYVDNNFLNLSGGLVSGSVRINNDLTVFGNLTASGTTTFANTIFSTTSSLSVVHVGSGPALWVGNNGDGDIASFYDIDSNVEILHVGGNNGTFPNVGVKTSEPNVDFTVNGQISANNTIWSADGNSNNWNSAFNTATIYQNTSGSFATNTLLQSTSALLTPLTLTSTLTSQLVLNTAISSLTGNWNSTYTTLCANSATWVKFQPNPEYIADDLSDAWYNNERYVENYTDYYVVPGTEYPDPRWIRKYNGESVWKIGYSSLGGDEGVDYTLITSSTNSIYPWNATWPLGTLVTKASAVRVVGQPLAVIGTEGTSQWSARADHKHPYPTYTQVGAAAASHTHPISQVIDLQGNLDAKATLNPEYYIDNQVYGIFAIRGGYGTFRLYKQTDPFINYYGESPYSLIGESCFKRDFFYGYKADSGNAAIAIGWDGVKWIARSDNSNFNSNATTSSDWPWYCTFDNNLEVTNNEGYEQIIGPSISPTLTIGEAYYSGASDKAARADHQHTLPYQAPDNDHQDIFITVPTFTYFNGSGDVTLSSQFFDVVYEGFNNNGYWPIRSNRKLQYSYGFRYSPGGEDPEVITNFNLSWTINGNVSAWKLIQTIDNQMGYVTTTVAASSLSNTTYPWEAIWTPSNTVITRQYNLTPLVPTLTGSVGISPYISRADHTHPAQILSLSGNNLSITNGNIISLSSFATNTLLQSTSALLTPLTLTRTLTSTLLTDAPSNGIQYARKNGAWTAVVTTSGGGGGGSAYSIVDTNFSALVNQKYLVDTTSISIVGTLPSTPSLGDNILFVDSYNNWGSSPLILDNNGNLLQTFNEPLTANISGYQFQLVYLGGLYGWKIV